MSDQSATPPPTPSTPTRISTTLVSAFRNRYEIIRETGRGASAIVYLARDLKHDRLVAIKTLNPDVGPVAGERFLREIQVSAGLQHPHILPTYDSGVADGRLYFVMPFVDGGALRQRLDAEPQMPIVEALRCAHDIALALAFAHDQGVVHRDIKPENIMYYHGHACLADFGVARVMEQIDVRVTGHGMVVGTPAYMSPEQLTDNGFDGRSDVYSLACVLYEMIAGEHAFSGTTPRELLTKRLRTPPEPIRKHRLDVPQFVDDLLLRALAANPAERFPDARAFAEAIEFVIRDLTVPTRVSGPRRALESVPRNPLLWAASLGVVAAFIALAATPLSDVVRGRSSVTPTAGTRTARESYEAGKHSLESWDLAAAERELARAASADPRFAVAQLRLAQTLELERRVDSDPFRLTAARLATNRSQLHGRDSLFAEGLIALAGASYQRACATFDRIRAADSLDAMAWYALGDCHALDSLVVPDAASPSGARFRSSWHAGVRAYMRAAAIDPSIHRALAYTTLSTLLVTTPTQVRFGRTARATLPTHAAHPSLSGDSIAFIPFPIGDVTAAKPVVVSSTLGDALRHNRETLLAFARQWIAATPTNPDAFEALATAYEARGELAATGDGAEGAVRHARTLAVTPEQRLRLASTEVRLRLKRGELEDARTLADSLLHAFDRVEPPGAEADRLAGLAALTGRLARAAELNAIATSSVNAARGIAPPLNGAASQLFLRAAAGVCDDSLLLMRGGVDQLLESYGQPARRDEMRRDLLGRSMSLAFPCLGRKALDALPAWSPVMIAQRAAASGDARRARALLDSLATVRRPVLPGDISLDQTVQEASLRLSIGDTAAAIRQLDRVLTALPTLGQWAVREPAQSVAVGRALALRADLAARAHDVPESRRRAREALELWRNADGALAPTVSRLRALAAVP